MFLRAIQKAASTLRKHPLPGRIALFCIPDMRKRIHIDQIGEFEIRLRRNRSFWLRHPLTHERYPLAALKQLIHSGDTVYDVGANIGLYTRFALGLFGAGTVVAFEPMTENRLMLQRNIDLGKVTDRVRILPFALSNVDDESAALQIDDMQTGSAALDAVKHGKAADGRAALGLKPKTEVVRCRRLDSLLAGGELPPPNVIKIDIEGAEKMMLEGAVEALQRHSPRLLIELHGAPIAREVVTFLLDRNYHLMGTGWKFSPANHGPVDRDLLPHIQDEYDLHFLVAAQNPDDLPQTVDTSAFGPAQAR